MAVIKLLEHLGKFVELGDRELSIINNHIKQIDLEPSEFLLKKGEDCASIYFVEHGCLRMLFVNKKSIEQITQFAIEGWWLTDYFSFLDRNPSDYYIQAVEPSKIISLDRFSFECLLKELPQLDRYFRYIMQRNIAASQLRIKYLYEMTKEELRNHFISSFPEFIKRIPMPMINSYLGIGSEYNSQ